MKKFIELIILIIIGYNFNIYAQSTANYAFTYSNTGSLTDMSSGTTDLLATGTYYDDVASSVTNLGFSFYFMGTAYTQFSINSNGLMKLGGTAINGSAITPEANMPYFAPIGGNNAIMSSGKVHYKLTGTTPNQVLIIEWRDLRIPNLNGTGTYCLVQARIYEGSSKIEYVYGTMYNNSTGITRPIFISSSNTAAGTIGSVTIGSTPTFTTNSATPIANSLPNNNYITNLHSTADGSRWLYTFIPESTSPAAPITMTATNITNNRLTLGWTDNSTTENYFVIYESTDGGSNYSVINSVVSTTKGTTGTAYTSNINGLASQTTYYFRVTANNEGSAPSSALQGFFATTAVISIKTGNWSDPTTWNSGLVPTANDTVTIADGDTVTINVAAVCKLLTIGQGTSGILQFERITVRTITVGGNVTIFANGIFRANTLGNQRGNQAIINGSLINNGTLDFGSAAGRADLKFTGATNESVTGSGNFNFLTLTVDKGTSQTPVLEFINVNPFTVLNNNGFLILVNGTFKFSSTTTQSTRMFATAIYTIPSTAGFWLNSSGTIINSQSTDTYLTVNGLLRISSGELDIGGGSTKGVLGFGSGAVFTIDQAPLTYNSSLQVRTMINTTNAVTVNISYGNINVCTGGNDSANTASFGFSNTSNTINFTGGTIFLEQANSNATISNRLDYDVKGSSLNFSNTTLQIGVASTAPILDFRAKGEFPITSISGGTTPKNLIIVGTDFYSTFRGNLTISSGSTFNLNGIGINVNNNIINNGIINGTTALSRLRFSGSSAQTLSGSGTVTSLLYSLEMNNSNGLNITHTNQVFCQNVVFYVGSISNANKITLGNGSSAVGVQFGDPTTASTGGGNFSVAPTFNIGTGSYKIKYYKESSVRTTGFEIPSGRTIDSLELNNNSSTLTVSGGSLTINKELTLTTGRIITDATNIIILSTSYTTPPSGSATSFISGPLSIQVNSSSNVSKTFAIGDGTNWRPIVLGAFHSGGALRTYMAQSFNSASGGTPVAPLLGLNRSRYFRIQGTISSTSTPTVQLSYGSDDLVGTTSTARVAQSTTSNGSYTSVGGTTASSPTTGIVSTSALGIGEYYILGNEAPYTITWDGTTGNWGDAAHWIPSIVPISVDDIVLTSSGSATITLNVGSTSVNKLSVTGGTLTLNLSSNTLTVNDNYSQSGGTLSTSTGTIDFKKDFTITSGTYSATSGTSQFSASANSQNISGATFYNLILTGGSSGSFVKNLIAGNSFTVSNDFTIQTTAEISLSSATSTTFNLAGNLIFGGAAGGSYLSSLTLNLTGSNKTINGSSTESKKSKNSEITKNEIKRVVDLRSKDVKEKSLYKFDGKKSEIERIISSKKPEERIVIELDDRTIIMPTIIKDNSATPSSAVEFNIAVATGASYTASDLLTINGNLTVNGRLNVGSVEPNLTGSGTIHLVNDGVIGNTSSSSEGGKNLIQIATQTYDNGSIFDYCASANQYIPTIHPSSSLIYTSGSGTKMLLDNLSISGNSGSSTGKNALNVGAGTTLDDGGKILTFSGSYANIKILGSYASSGSGGIQWSTGFASSIIAANNTVFGDIALNDRDILLKANGSSSNVTFRSFSTGGIAGGTLHVDDSGHTPLTISGNVSINPSTKSNMGGGFDGTSGANGYVLVQGNFTSLSTNTNQYLFGTTGTNVIEFSNTSAQTITGGGASTILPSNDTMRVNNTAGFQVNTNIYTIQGTLELKNGSAISGSGGGGITYSGANSGLMFTGSTSSTTTDNELPSTNGPAYFTVNKASSSDQVTLHASRSFNGVITLTRGVLAIGGASGDEHTLSMQSGFTYVSGNATLVGGLFSNLTFANASGPAATLPGVTVKNLEINRNAGVTLAGDVTVNGTSTFANGNLFTSTYQVIFTSTATTPTELNGTSINGKAFMQQRSIGTGAINFLGVSWASGGADVGLVDITRYTGTAVNFGGNQGIKEYWVINASIQPSAGKSVTYDWFSEYDNGKSFSSTNKGGVWRSTDAGSTWGLVDVEQDVSGSEHRIITVNTTQFSQWTATDHNSPLSIELASFTASINGRDVRLDWTTTEEINNQGFDIERALFNANTPENQSWSKIGYVESKKNNHGISNYDYTDKNLVSGKYLYRLKQIDYNGNFAYYSLKNDVIIGIPKKFDLSQNYPNPFNPVTKIDYNLSFDSKLSIKIYDISGREIMTLINENKPAGFYTLQFDAHNLASGAYFYRLIADYNTGKFVETKKMMLIK